MMVSCLANAERRIAGDLFRFQVTSYGLQVMSACNFNDAEFVELIFSRRATMFTDSNTLSGYLL